MRATISKISALLAIVAFGMTHECVAQAPDIAKFDDPSAKSGVSGSSDRIVLEAGDADAKATARVAKIFRTRPSDSIEIIPRIALTLSAPFDSKKADKVDVGSLSGLTAGTTGSLDVSFLFWPIPANGDGINLVSLCDKLLQQLIPGYGWSDVSGAGFTCDHRLLTQARLVEVTKKLNERMNELRGECKKCGEGTNAKPSHCSVLTRALIDACGNPDASTEAVCAFTRVNRDEACEQCDKIKSSCSGLRERREATLADNAKEILAKQRREIARADRAAFPAQHGLNMNLKGNRQDFKYVLPDTPTADATDVEKQGVGVSLAYSHLSASSLWSAGYSHEKSFKASDTIQVCSPLGTTASTTCKEAVIGAPKEKTAELAFIENRRLLVAGRFAVARRFEYDLKKSDWALSMPLYFLANPNAKNALTGGVALGYSKSGDKDKNGARVAVFISKAFSLFD